MHIGRGGCRDVSLKTKCTLAFTGSWQGSGSSESYSNNNNGNNLSHLPLRVMNILIISLVYFHSGIPILSSLLNVPSHIPTKQREASQVVNSTLLLFTACAAVVDTQPRTPAHLATIFLALST